uniref:rRNA biogenesis protein RRP36 n=1 Tax=Setaria digitata TaxID=48799 RepID=A0A915Q0A2_9BILA
MNKAKKEIVCTQQNVGNQSKETVHAIPTKNEFVTQTLDNGRRSKVRERILYENRSKNSKERLSSITDTEDNSINFSASELKSDDDKFLLSNDEIQSYNEDSADEKNVDFVRHRRESQDIVASPAKEHENSVDDASFREEIAKMPLRKAKQLQEQLGKKLFDRAFFAENSSSNFKKKLIQRNFVRENPKRPREVSSKLPVSKFRNVFENEKLGRPILDPRFDDRCGEFNDYIYQNNYGFLNEIRQQEKKMLMKELKKTEEGNINRDRLKEALKKMKNQEKTQADVNRRKEIIREIRHENNERMRQGLPPVFKTRAQIRQLIWQKKYDELKGGKKLEKYLLRKVKKQDKRHGINILVTREDKTASHSND